MNRFLKYVSITLPCLIGVAAICFIIRNQWKIESLDQERIALEAKMNVLNIGDSNKYAPTKQISTKYFQREKTALPRMPKTAKGFFDYALAIQQAKYQGKMDDIETLKLNTEFLDGLMRLDSRGIQELLGLLRKDDLIEYDTRMEIATFAMNMLKERDLDACLKICLDSTDLLEENLMDRVVAEWARKDVNAALAWMKQHATARPDIVNDDSKSALIYAVGDVAVTANDYRTAFNLISELKIKYDYLGAKSIIMKAQTSERRSLALAEFRNFTSGIENTDDRERIARGGFSALAQSLRLETTDDAIAWVNNASFSQVELDMFADRFNHNTIEKNHSKWFDWMNENLTPERRDEKIISVVGRWTGYDYHAAGEWLANAPDDGVIKPVAVRAYVEAVAPFEPKNAEDWALTLPANDMRQELLLQIYQQWPKGNEAEKSAFATRHDLKVK